MSYLPAVSEMQDCVEKRSALPVCRLRSLANNGTEPESPASDVGAEGGIMSLKHSLDRRHELAYPLLRWLLSA